MVTVKVFSSSGVKELKCFDTLEEVPYLPIQEEEDTETEQCEDE